MANHQQPPYPATGVLITDRISQLQDSIVALPQIWLLDSQRPLPALIPVQVKGLLVSDCDLTELEMCVRRILLHQSYVSPALLGLLTKHTDEVPSTNSQPLTPREQQIFELIKAGLSIREIAERLFISPHTAENHRANIQRKMALTGRLSLVRYAASVQNPVK